MEDPIQNSKLKLQRQAVAQACNFIKKGTLAQVFSVNFAKFVRKPFFHRTPPVAASIQSNMHSQSGF